MLEKRRGYAITSQSLPADLAAQVHIIDSLHDLPEKDCFFVVLDFTSTARPDCLNEIRKKNHYQLTPFFYLGQAPLYAEQLFDAPFDENSYEKAVAIQERMKLTKIAGEDHLSEFEKLLASYLFVREGMILKGYIDYRSPMGFKYPLLDALGFNEDSERYWYMLEGMEARKLLKHEMLVDEIQTCADCKSGLLNFKNCCPNCDSSHIVSQSFVHCFACGNIGPLSEFLKYDELVCSRCMVKLRHIGIDYDKPMEDKICQDCHHSFFESNVNAVCMVCKKLSDPEDLVTKHLYEYVLASRGEGLAKGIEQHLVVELGQFLKLIDMSIFMMILRWQTRVAKRHAVCIFTLIALKVKNEAALIEQYGIVKTEKMLLEFYSRVREMLRDSDLVTRDNNTLLFYLPMTPPENVSVIFDRLQSFTAATLGEGLKIEISLGRMSSEEIIDRDISMDMLLPEIYNRLD